MNTIVLEQFVILLQLLKKANMHESDKNTKKINIFKIRQLSNAVNVLNNIDYIFTINNIDKLLLLPGIGKGTVARIAEILNTGTLQEIQYLRDFIARQTMSNNNLLKLINELSAIIGIGNKIALKLITEHDITSLFDFKDKVINEKILVNDKIKMGLKYLDVYKQNIPRIEIDKINEYLNDVIGQIDKKYLFIICGSYRRNKQKSNDVDILLIHTDVLTINDLKELDHGKKNIYLQTVVNILHDKLFILDDLTVANGTKYMGFCQLSSDYPVRRIDIRMMSIQSFFPALLYFTGSYEFNQKMRSIAKKQGYKLNEYGLFNLKTDVAMQILNEKMTFDILKMEYLEPFERDFDRGIIDDNLG